MVPVGYGDAGERSCTAEPREMTTAAATFAARLADLQERSNATDKAAAATLQELKAQGQQLADAMAGVAAAMKD